MNDTIYRELVWWVENIIPSIRYVVYPNPILTLYSDASKKGWGGHIENGPSTGGDWTESEAQDHINVLELKGAFLTLQCVASNYKNCHVRMMLDNTTAVTCLNKFGSTKIDLLRLTQEIYEWAKFRGLFLSAAYIPGVQKVLADRESRTHNTDIEWRLKKKWFRYICEELGCPEIDLFASRINHQLEKYVSWRPDPRAIWIDAFSMSWKNVYGYAFPPFSLLHKFFQKLEQDRGVILLVYPHWPTASWFSRLLKRRVSREISLPISSLELPQGGSRSHPMAWRLRLHACIVSARSTHDMGSVRK